jgi:PilZ domain
MADATTNSVAVESTRLHPRYPPDSVRGITGVRLSPGEVVTLVNISISGILVEGKTRFVPGTRLNVIFEGPDAPAAVKGRVVRCQVSAIGGGGSLQYQSAIAFEANIELPIDEAAKPADVEPAPATEAPKQTKPTAPPEASSPQPRNRW